MRRSASGLGIRRRGQHAWPRACPAAVRKRPHSPARLPLRRPGVHGPHPSANLQGAPLAGPRQMTILADHVAAYLTSLRPGRGPVMAEMEALAERDGVPIVHWETGRLLAALCRTMDPVVLEVGTAIGYSTLHMAEQLDRGRVVTLEVDPARAAQARDFFARAGVSGRIELVEGD